MSLLKYESTLKGVILSHAAKYPKMRPCDAVKLLYQGEFGVGHMIKSPESFEKYLLEEINNTKTDPSVPLWEDIGFGFVRVNLASESFEKQIGARKLAEMCLESAEKTCGDEIRFIEKMAYLAFLSAFEETGFDFSKEEMDEYIRSYIESGMPPVHHSSVYEALYRPAYRVCLKGVKGGGIFT